MTYTYPKVLGCLSYKRINAEQVKVKNHLTDEECIVDLECARFMKKLDGFTEPYEIPTALSIEEIDAFIDELDDMDLLKPSNIMFTESDTILFTLWEIKWTAFMRVLAFFFNKVLQLFWLPALLVGTFVFYNNMSALKLDAMWLGSILGLVFGLVLHEFAHAFAGVNYGAKVFEMGVLLMYRVVPGAYVIMDCATVKNKMHRIKIDAAGVESNFMLCGIFLFLAGTCKFVGGIFVVAAITNLLLGMSNLLFANGYDGASIIGELIGAENMVDRMCQVLRSHKARRRLAKRGLVGKAVLAACGLFGIFQLIVPLLILSSIVEAIACFV